MFNALTGLGWGVVTFAITIGIGTIVLSKFGGAVANCPDVGESTFTYGGNNSYLETCVNDTDNADGNYDPADSGWVNTQYLNTQLGTSGLAGWTPAIIAFAVGMLFLGGFLVNRGGKRSY